MCCFVKDMLNFWGVGQSYGSVTEEACNTAEAVLRAALGSVTERGAVLRYPCNYIRNLVRGFMNAAIYIY